LLVATSKTRVLVDLGVSERRLKFLLASVGVEPGEIDAVLVTHTHGDHFTRSAAGFCWRHDVPVYSCDANLEHLERRVPRFRRLAEAGLAQGLDGRPVEVGDVRVEAFEVPHDAPGVCLGFRLSLGSGRGRRTVAVATDLGHVPDDCLGRFIDAEVVVLESNHDVDLLHESGRPLDLIDRIEGPSGHLSNAEAAESLAEIVGRSRAGCVGAVVLAHLSRDCNRPELALSAQGHLARRSGAPRVWAAEQFEAGPRVRL